MGFSRQEYWSVLPHPSPGNLPNPGIEPPISCIAGGFFNLWATGEALTGVKASIKGCYIQKHVEKHSVGTKWIGQFDRRRQWHPTLVLLPGKFHGWRSLVGCSTWGHRESNMTWVTSLSLFTFMHWRRKWQPTPVFLSGKSQDGGAWWAAVYGVAQSRTWLKWLRISSSRSQFEGVRGRDFGNLSCC